VQVIYGELKGQGMRIASKSLWDPNFDNWASYTFTNSNIHCTGIVFGDYFE
jgi:tctex1 domain-containing protein 2